MFRHSPSSRTNQNLDLTFRLSNTYSVPQSGETFDLKAIMTSKIDTLPIDATAKITIPAISCMISASSSSVIGGQNVTYTLTVFNKSKYLASNVNIWADWTRDMSFGQSVPQGNLRGNKILFTLRSLAPGGREVFKVTLKVANDCNANHWLSAADVHPTRHTRNNTLLQSLSPIPYRAAFLRLLQCGRELTQKLQLQKLVSLSL